MAGRQDVINDVSELKSEQPESPKLDIASITENKAEALCIVKDHGGKDPVNPEFPKADDLLAVSPYDYPGSLVGQKLIVDQQGDGSDFSSVYPEADPNGVYTVTEDNEGITSDGSGIRVATLKDANGNEIFGNVSRFMFPKECPEYLGS
jgi:hypothetical protein